MGGRSAFGNLLLLSISVFGLHMSLLDQRLQLLAGVKRDDAPSGDGNFLAGLGVTPRALRLVAQLEVSEPRQLHAFAVFQRQADLLEESLHHVLRLALV